MLMMNQGVNTQTIASVDPNSLEGRYVVDVSQGQTSSYNPTAYESEAAPWTMHRVDNHSTENGILSNSSYHHDHRTQQLARSAQDSLNTASLASSSTQGTMSVTQDHSSYAAYNPTDPYGYGSSGYSSYYNNGYQQQPSHAYSQQQPSHSYSQQQPSHSYSQQQPSHSYSQQQPSHSYSQQQPSHSYSSTGGAYQNTDSWRLPK